ncbi:hypothetical protein LQ327_09815 [Actinomycetospora endophytica]|uniref:Low temperature requirement A protein (LtrA) n=1 Tax=Actinomycetospora endophytica TaxID=2291215 RepID=A0ABS8P5Z4_9PSEU|nr:hypothetical protein [Actinomycetospora endophytica]MCD2193675.1 hypothetical protein [Actinomycetospora endophytica]
MDVGEPRPQADDSEIPALALIATGLMFLNTSTGAQTAWLVLTVLVAVAARLDWTAAAQRLDQ